MLLLLLLLFWDDGEGEVERDADDTNWQAVDNTQRTDIAHRNMLHENMCVVLHFLIWETRNVKRSVLQLRLVIVKSDLPLNLKNKQTRTNKKGNAITSRVRSIIASSESGQ
jgi:hypothetical protein